MNWIGSMVWSALNAIVRAMRRPAQWTVPVVSVGNIEAGGTGKTPWVIAVAQFLAEQGSIPVVLSRGYRGQIARGRSAKFSAPELDERLLDPAQWGDECAEIAQRVPAAWIGVGRKRDQAWEQIKSQLGESDLRRVVVILDDGLQQFGIARNLDLVLVTGRRTRHVLFRDLFFRVAKELETKTLWIWTKDVKPPLGWNLRPSSARYKIPFVLNASQPLSGKRVYLVCGVGHPESVENGLIELHANLVGAVRRPDHAAYSREQVLSYAAEAERQSAILVTTSKDSVKWKAVLQVSDALTWVVLETRPQEEGFLAVSTRLLRAVQVE